MFLVDKLSQMPKKRVETAEIQLRMLKQQHLLLLKMRMMRKPRRSLSSYLKSKPKSLLTALWNLMESLYPRIWAISATPRYWPCSTQSTCHRSRAQAAARTPPQNHKTLRISKLEIWVSFSNRSGRATTRGTTCIPQVTLITKSSNTLRTSWVRRFNIPLGIKTCLENSKYSMPRALISPPRLTHKPSWAWKILKMWFHTVQLSQNLLTSRVRNPAESLLNKARCDKEPIRVILKRLRRQLGLSLPAEETVLRATKRLPMVKILKILVMVVSSKCPSRYSATISTISNNASRTSQGCTI